MTFNKAMKLAWVELGQVQIKQEVVFKIEVLDAVIVVVEVLGHFWVRCWLGANMQTRAAHTAQSCGNHLTFEKISSKNPP